MSTGIITVEELLSHRQWLSSLAYSLVGNRDDAEDLVQATMVRALENPPQQQDRIRGWLRSVARNTAFNLYRSRRRENRRTAALSGRAEVLERVVKDPVAQSVERHEMERLVFAAVDRLSEAQLIPLRMRFIEKRPFEEVAAALEVSEAAARKRVSRSLETLRQRLRTELGENWRQKLSAAFGFSLPSVAAPLGPLLAAAGVIVVLGGLAWQLLPDPAGIAEGGPAMAASAPTEAAEDPELAPDQDPAPAASETPLESRTVIPLTTPGPASTEAAADTAAAVEAPPSLPANGAASTAIAVDPITGAPIPGMGWGAGRDGTVRSAATKADGVADFLLTGVRPYLVRTVPERGTRHGIVAGIDQHQLSPGRSPDDPLRIPVWAAPDRIRLQALLPGTRAPALDARVWLVEQSPTVWRGPAHARPLAANSGKVDLPNPSLARRSAVWVELEGYLRQCLILDHFDSPPAEVELVPATEARITLLDADQRPMGGAEVSWSRYFDCLSLAPDREPSAEERGVAVLDQNGVFSVPVPTDLENFSYHFRVTVNGQEVEQGGVDGGVIGPDYQYLWRLPPPPAPDAPTPTAVTATLSGTLFEADGRTAASSVLVEVRVRGSSQSLGFAALAPEGRFHFPQLPIGPLTLVVSEAGHDFHRVALDLPAEGLNLHLPGYRSVKVSSWDRALQPIQDKVEVLLDPADGNAVRRAARGDGEPLIFDRAPTAPFWVAARIQEDGEWTAQRVPAGATDCGFELRPGRVARLAVEFEPGELPDGVRCYRVEEDLENPLWRTRREVNAKGELWIYGAPLGDFWVVFRDDEGREVREAVLVQ